MRHFTKEEAKKFLEERCSFLEYNSIQEYIEDIVVCLMYSSWHYTEKETRERCEERMVWIEYFYENKTPADDASVDIGFSCG